MPGSFLSALCMLGLMMVEPAQSTRVQRDLAKDKLKYEQANNAVDRAKALGKLGHEEYVAARQAVDAGKTDEALQLLKDYNEQVTDTHAALLKTGKDPAKNSNGFRQLQISVRERERDLKDLIRRIGFEQSDPFEKLGKGLDQVNQKLIQELFPRRAPNKQTHEETENPQEHQ
jgi:hypothetical protein